MDLELLIDRIRREEVALIIGSGLSLYAGYIGAYSLKERIRLVAEKYCEDDYEKEGLKEKNLEEIAECLIRFGDGRGELNSILLAEYRKLPVNTHTHDRLGRIPHFEHIFTTNYDTLIEDGMERRCHIIGSELGFPLQSNRLPKVYKLHGDVNNLDEVVIARQDYARNISGQRDNLLWNRFYDIIASKDILFLGHGYEDSNFWGVFEHFDKKLSGHQRKKFLISPKLSSHQEINLKKKGFTYFRMDADQFLDVLHPKLMEFAVSDLEDGVLSLDTFKRFIGFNEKNAIIKSDDQKVRVEAILERNGTSHPEVKFSMKEDIYKEFLKFNTGMTRSRSFTFAQEDLVNFSMNMSGFKFPLDETKMETLKVMLIHETKVLDIESADGEIDLADIEVKQFRYADGSDIEFVIYGTIFTFSFTQLNKAAKMTAKFGLPEQFKSLRDAFGTIKLISGLFTGKAFDFYFDKKKPIRICNDTPGDVEIDGWRSIALLDHFGQLKFLEKKLKLKFTIISLADITEQVTSEVNFLYRVFNDGFVEQELEKIIIMPGELRKYISPNKGGNDDRDASLVLELPRNYVFYGTPLPKFYGHIEVLDHEFVREGGYFGVKSKVGKIRHKLLDTEELRLFQLRESKMLSAEELINNPE